MTHSLQRYVVTTSWCSGDSIFNLSLVTSNPPLLRQGMDELELPERLIGTVRNSHINLKTITVKPTTSADGSSETDDSNVAWEAIPSPHDSPPAKDSSKKPKRRKSFTMHSSSGRQRSLSPYKQNTASRLRACVSTTTLRCVALLTKPNTPPPTDRERPTLLLSTPRERCDSVDWNGNRRR